MDGRTDRRTDGRTDGRRRLQYPQRFFSHILIFRKSVFYLTYQALRLVIVWPLTSLLTMDLVKGLMMHIIGQEQHFF